MVRVSVEIFEEEDRIVEEAREKYGFRTKNDALNFIIRKFEKHLKEAEEEMKEAQSMHKLFVEGEKISKAERQPVKKKQKK